MTHVLEVNATVREIMGKASHKLAPAGLVPAVVYGPDFDALPLSVDQREFERLLHSATVGSSLLDLKIEGRAKPVDVIIKEVKRHEVKGTLQHIDFWAVNMRETLQTAVPITFVGSAEGERTGGVMMHALRELRVEARPKDLPEHIEADISSLSVGESLTVADLPVPAGVTLLDDLETVVASVMAPAVEEEELVPEIGEAVEVPEVGKETDEDAEE